MEQQIKEQLARQNSINVMANIFTETRDDAKTSERYLKFDDGKVLQVLNDNGWFITKYREVKAQSKGRQQFKPYLAQYTNKNVKPFHDGLPSIIQRGAHDGTKTLDLFLGFFRSVCENGLIVGENLLTPVHLKHIGTADRAAELNDVVGHLVSNMPKVMDQVTAMDTRILTLDESMTFAKDASEIRFGEKSKGVDPRELLIVRRSADTGMSLWKVFNRVQEAIINAPHLQIVNEDNKQRKVRALTSIEQQVSINRDLWAVAEKFLQ